VSPIIRKLVPCALLALAVAGVAQAQQPARPQIQTTKVEGTDGVYIFRNGAHQSIFIVTSEGVIATDPVAYGRPTGGQAYVDEIRKVTPTAGILFKPFRATALEEAVRAALAPS